MKYEGQDNPKFGIKNGEEKEKVKSMIMNVILLILIVAITTVANSQETGLY